MGLFRSAETIRVQAIDAELRFVGTDLQRLRLGGSPAEAELAQVQHRIDELLDRRLDLHQAALIDSYEQLMSATR